jgi:hypothetical protein
MLNLALLALMLQAPSQKPVAVGQVQVGTSVSPETTTVGQHFVATIRVRIPEGSRVQFPAIPDSAAKVDSVGSVTRTDTTANGFTESTARYVLAAWDTGSQRLGLDSVLVISTSGERIAPLKAFQVYVRSVLPADTSLRKPKPFRDLIAVTPFNWLPWAIALAAAALVAIMIFAWRRWRRRLAAGLSPRELAEREFARIESRRLIESGETEQYAIEMVAVLRAYLASVIPAAPRSATTHELAETLRHTNAVPLQPLVELLDSTDLLKFARERMAPERAREAGSSARRIVSGTSEALAVAATAEKAA